MIDDNGKPVQRAVTVGGVTSVIGADSATLASVNKNASIWFPSTSINGFYSQSFAVEDGSYLRINNITLGYAIPKSILSKLKISSFRIYATVNNLATITGYTGYDPDASTRRSDPTTPGVDYAAYPRARTYVAGLNITF
jgi:TonB-dependent starch-binding outer membrane protein SusC